MPHHSGEPKDVKIRSGGKALICGLLNDDLNSSGYTASNARMKMNNKDIKKAIVSCFKVLSQDKRSLGHSFEAETSRKVSEELNIWLRQSVIWEKERNNLTKEEHKYIHYTQNLKQ